MPTPYKYQIQFGSFCITGGGQIGRGTIVTEKSPPKTTIGFNPPQSPPVSSPTAPAASDNGHKDQRPKGGDDDR